MHDDLIDGVDWLIAHAQGVADPGKVAIYGASYGGYAALVGTCPETRRLDSRSSSTQMLLLLAYSLNLKQV
jgi:predicted dienelactone hydrolase